MAAEGDDGNNTDSGSTCRAAALKLKLFFSRIMSTRELSPFPLNGFLTRYSIEFLSRRALQMEKKRKEIDGRGILQVNGEWDHILAV